MLPTMYVSSRNNGLFPSIFSDFDRMFNDNWLVPQFHTTAPAINISEDDKEYKVDVAAPGMTKDDFHISLNDDDIVISMEKKNVNNNDDANKAENKKYLHREFSYSKFEQHFTLPENVERKNISAEMQDGILHINLPKMTEEEKKQETQYIEIK